MTGENLLYRSDGVQVKIHVNFDNYTVWGYKSRYGGKVSYHQAEHQSAHKPFCRSRVGRKLSYKGILKKCISLPNNNMIRF